MRSQIKTGVILSYIIIIGNVFIGVFLTPLMLTHLGQEQYGLYQLLGALVANLAILDFGLGNAVTRYIAQYREERRKDMETKFVSNILFLYCAIALLVSFVGILLYFNLGYIFGKTMDGRVLAEARTMLLVLLINIYISLVGNVFGGVVNAYEQYQFSRGVNLCRLLLRVFMVVALLKLGYGALAIVALDTMLNLASTFVNYYICINKLNLKIQWVKLDPRLLQEVWGYSFFIFLNIIFDQLLWKINPTIIGIKISMAAVAVFSIGMQFSAIFMQFATAISGVFLPKITRMIAYGVDMMQLTDFMIKAGRLQSVFLLYVYTAFIIFGRQFIQLWIGNGYNEAWLCAVFVMTGLLIPLIENVGLSILQAMKKHQVYVYIYLLICIVTAITTYFIVEDFGITGAAFMTMSSLILGNMCINWYYYKLGLNVWLFFKECGRLMIIAAFIGALYNYGVNCFNIQLVSWANFIAATSLYTATYALLLWAVGLNKYEKDLIETSFNNLFKRGE